MRITKENILEEARKNNLEVLKSNLVDKVKDDRGVTPLYLLAWYGVKEALHHPSVDQVKDHDGWTPLHELAYWNHIAVKDLKKRFPWYKKEIKNIMKAVNEIYFRRS